MMLNVTSPEVFKMIKKIEEKNYCTMMNGKQICKINTNDR